MKQILKLSLILLAIIAVLSCSESAPEDAETGTKTTESGITVDNAFYYTHVNGHKEESEKVAFVLFEYEQLENVKYQVAYIACTCRGPQVNYWSVAYVELSKEDGSVQLISWDKDSTEHYTAGMYGDSVETWEHVPAHDLLMQFTEDNITGKSQEYIFGLEAMHGDVDDYTGATVTPNNAVRMLHGLMEYHNRKYM